MQKDDQLLRKRFLELSRLAHHREIAVFTDFLSLHELNLLHTTPHAQMHSRYITYGGYAQSERQMAAFVSDALFLCDESVNWPFTALYVQPLHEKYGQELSHRDYLGAILNLGIERAKIGDILVMDKSAYFFAHTSLTSFLMDELTRISHTTVKVTMLEKGQDFSYINKYEEIKGTVASIRLDSLLSLAFSLSRTRFTDVIEAGRVFVNGRMITTNAYKIKDDDIISVRGMGKFQYMGIQSTTKKNRLTVIIHKYM